MRHGRYSEAFRRKDEATIADLYHSNGFRDVKVTSAVTRNYKGKNGAVAVTVTIAEGPQWTVDSLTLNGLGEADRKALEGSLASAAGQPFAEANLAADRNEVLTYYYTRGYPDADFHGIWQPVAGAEHRVNVTYTVSPGGRQFVR